jgi:hypothetical protein
MNGLFLPIPRFRYFDRFGFGFGIKISPQTRL